MKKLSFVKIFLAAFFTAFPLGTFAAEIRYPPFFPIDTATNINDLTKIFFSGALGIGAVVAAGYVVFLGFQILTSRGNPTRTLAMRNRIIQVLAGLALLGGGMLVLLMINPEIARISPLNITFGTQTPQKAPTLPQTSTNEQRFVSDDTGRQLDFTDIFLNKIDDNPMLENIRNETTLALLQARAKKVKDDLALCSADLCKGPGTVSYAENHTLPCGPIDPDTGEYPCPPPTCDANSATCTADACSGDPVPQRSDANLQLGNPADNPARGIVADDDTKATVVGSFRALQKFWQNTIKGQRDAIRKCIVTQGNEHTFFSTYVDALQIAQDPKNPSRNKVVDACNAHYPNLWDPVVPCQESTDFFCPNDIKSPTAFRRMHLSLDDPNPSTLNGLLQKEQKFIDIVNKIVYDINARSCSNTNWDCGVTSCDSTPTSGTCTDRNSPPPSPQNVNGCTADMAPDLIKLEDILVRMETLHDALQTDITDANGMGNIAIVNYTAASSGNNFFIDSCASAKTMVTDKCPQSASDAPRICCPDQHTKDDIERCEVEDFYSCITNI